MKYQSKQLGVIHETAKGLFDAGLLSVTDMHDFDTGCLAPPASPRREMASAGTADRPTVPIPAVAAPRP